MFKLLFLAGVSATALAARTTCPSTFTLQVIDTDSSISGWNLTAGVSGIETVEQGTGDPYYLNGTDLIAKSYGDVIYAFNYARSTKQATTVLSIGGGGMSPLTCKLLPQSSGICTLNCTVVVTPKNNEGTTTGPSATYPNWLFCTYSGSGYPELNMGPKKFKQNPAARDPCTAVGLAANSVPTGKA